MVISNFTFKSSISKLFLSDTINSFNHLMLNLTEFLFYLFLNLYPSSDFLIPWTLVAANDKHFARIQVLKTVVKSLENAL